MSKLAATKDIAHQKKKLDYWLSFSLKKVHARVRIRVNDKDDRMKSMSTRKMSLSA